MASKLAGGDDDGCCHIRSCLDIFCALRLLACHFKWPKQQRCAPYKKTEEQQKQARFVTPSNFGFKKDTEIVITLIFNVDINVHKSLKSYYVKLDFSSFLVIQSNS